MPHGTRASEFLLYKKNFFKQIPPIHQLDIQKIKERKLSVIFERHAYYPMDYFFFTHENHHYFGRKMLSSLYLENKQHIKKCNQITAPMLLGLVLRTQVTEKGILIFYKSIENNEKAFLFNKLKENAKIDIYFPFPVLNHEMKEHVQSSEAWDINDKMAEELNIGEEHIRTYTIDFLSHYDLTGKIIYDPACSTGKFLGSIKAAYPTVKVIGQDINSDMIHFAKKHADIDELHIGSALYPCVAEESVDFIFIRFLNLSVLSSEQALKLFCKIAQCCKNDGLIIVFGFTPVLLSAQIFEMLNLNIQQTTAFDKENNSVYQYYVLKKSGPIPMLRYEDFSLFKFSSQEMNHESNNNHIMRAKL